MSVCSFFLYNCSDLSAGDAFRVKRFEFNPVLSDLTLLPTLVKCHCTDLYIVLSVNKKTLDVIVID